RGGRRQHVVGGGAAPVVHRDRGGEALPHGQRSLRQRERRHLQVGRALHRRGGGGAGPGGERGAGGGGRPGDDGGVLQRAPPAPVLHEAPAERLGGAPGGGARGQHGGGVAAGASGGALGRRVGRGEDQVGRRPAVVPDRERHAVGGAALDDRRGGEGLD